MSKLRLCDRVLLIRKLFYQLQSTGSLIEKQYYLNESPDALKDDVTYCLELLAGKHKLGYTFVPTSGTSNDCYEELTLREYFAPLWDPLRQKDLSEANIRTAIDKIPCYQNFIEPIVNRTLRLGIGPSILPKDSMSAMLSKKYEGRLPANTYFAITEKLDGNRCIAWFNGNEWVYQSRNGKIMNVKFDMTDLPTDLVYDGEILSPKQVEMSNVIKEIIVKGTTYNKTFADSFSSTSGLINSHAKNKDLIYNIFDIQYDGVSYVERRKILHTIKPVGKNVRIIPVLKWFNSRDEANKLLPDMLNTVTNVGGEGLMINLANSNYTHGRTDVLLKYKSIKTMDLIVESVYDGTGKYAGMVGGLNCIARYGDKGIVQVSVGSGLSDKQRFDWSVDEHTIVGKIVEVEYFSLSQNSNNAGTELYSLRFPRLKKVRTDKSVTSIY